MDYKCHAIFRTACQEEREKIQSAEGLRIGRDLSFSIREYLKILRLI
jgi:hypothetical protein